MWGGQSWPRPAFSRPAEGFDTANGRPPKRAAAAKIGRPTSPLEDRRQLQRGYDFQLCVGAILRALICPPPAEMRHVAEATSLHVLVRDLHHQLDPQRLPRKILAHAPATLHPRHTLSLRTRPFLPRM